jgi:hypothetical protein
MNTRDSRLLARYWTRPNRDKAIKIESVVICLLDCANILLIGNFGAPYVTVCEAELFTLNTYCARDYYIAQANTV